MERMLSAHKRGFLRFPGACLCTLETVGPISCRAHARWPLTTACASWHTAHVTAQASVAIFRSGHGLSPAETRQTRHCTYREPVDARYFSHLLISLVCRSLAYTLLVQTLRSYLHYGINTNEYHTSIHPTGLSPISRESSRATGPSRPRRKPFEPKLNTLSRYVRILYNTCVHTYTILTLVYNFSDLLGQTICDVLYLWPSLKFTSVGVSLASGVAVCSISPVRLTCWQLILCKSFFYQVHECTKC